MRKAFLASCVLFLTSVLGVSAAQALTVQAKASNGDALAGNNANANVLVLVTNTEMGVPVVTLAKPDFTVVDHFALPGQSCGFSSNITGFNNVGTGAYQITIATHATTPPPGGCKWVHGTYLGQVVVKVSTETGQGAFALAIP